MSAGAISFSLGLFILAGLCEIAGGWMVWQWLRESRPWTWGLFGAIVLILYGIIPTFQGAHFGRVYAAYGGFFIVLSLLWGWLLDGEQTGSNGFDWRRGEFARGCDDDVLA